MTGKRVSMVCFGDIRNPINGYVTRCLKLALKLSERYSEVNVIQFVERDGFDTVGPLSVHSIGIDHERKNETYVSRKLTFNPLKSVRFPFESYIKMRKIGSLIDGCETVYVEGCLLLGPFVFLRNRRTNITLDTHCVNMDVAKRMLPTRPLIARTRILVWRALESYILNNSDNIVAISKADAESIKLNYGVDPSKVRVVPHIVDDADYAAFYDESQVLRDNLAGGFTSIACYVGDLGAIQNATAAAYIEHTLAPQSPDTLFVIVGKNNAKRKSQNNLLYTDVVPAVDPYIIMADICIAPMSIGSGVKTKMLDYMKYVKPIIATSVALEGITARNYSGLMVRSELESFSQELNNMVRAI